MRSSASPSRRSCSSASADNRWQRGLVGAATNVSSPRPTSSPPSPSPSPSQSPGIGYVTYDYPPSPSGNRSVAFGNRRLRLRPRRLAAESCHHSGSRSSSSVDDDGDEDYNPTLDDHRRLSKSHDGRGMELIKKVRRRIVDSNSNSKKMIQDQESDGQSRGGRTPFGNRSLQNENRPVSSHPSGNRSIRNENRLLPRAVVAAKCSQSRSGFGSHSDDAEYNPAGRRQRKLRNKNVILDVDPDQNRKRIVHSNSNKVVQDQESSKDGNGQSGGGSDTGLDGQNLKNGEDADQLRKWRIYFRENKMRQQAADVAAESSPKSPLSLLKTSFCRLSAIVKHNMKELKILGSQIRRLQGDLHGQQPRQETRIRESEEEEAAYWLGYLECRHQMKQDLHRQGLRDWSPPSDGGYAC